MLPFLYRMTAPKCAACVTMLQLRIAWAFRCSVKLSVQLVDASTSVMEDFKMEPVTLVGFAFLFDGCS